MWEAALSGYEQVRTLARFLACRLGRAVSLATGKHRPSDSAWSPGQKGTALRSASLRSKLPHRFLPPRFFKYRSSSLKTHPQYFCM